MCNAWNHYADCTCGWGTGDGNFGGISSWVPPITNTIESYTNRNALCPECGASVFFYKSSNGGRVFFDELGPPWPKHPCTDNNSTPARVTLQESIKHFKIKKSNQWQRDGWTPLFITFASRIDISILKVCGLINDKEIQLYIASSHNDINLKTIAYVKKTNTSAYQLSFITESATQLTVKASLRVSELYNNSKIVTKHLNQKSAHQSDTKGLKSKANFLMNKKEYSKKPKNKAIAKAFSELQKNTNDS